MPMKSAPKKASKKTRNRIVSANIREFHKGGRYKQMTQKFGKAKANMIAVAAGLSSATRKKAPKKKK